MGRSSNRSNRHIVVPKLPKSSVGQLLVHAKAIVRAMTKNPAFPSPNPPLATVQAAIDALDSAQTATRTHAVGTVAERDERCRELRPLLDQLAAYVQTVADADPANGASIIEGASMSVKRVGAKPPRVFAAQRGRVSGEVVLVAPRAGERAAYEWAQSSDGGKTWTPLPVTTTSTTTVGGLTPGQRAWFRWRVTVKGVTGDWSDPVEIIVD